MRFHTSKPTHLLVHSEYVVDLTGYPLQQLYLNPVFQARWHGVWGGLQTLSQGIADCMHRDILFHI